MEPTTTYSRKFASEVTSYECPECGHAVMRSPTDDGPEFVDGDHRDAGEWEPLR